MQIGFKLHPEYPIISHTESYYQLRKSLGHQSLSVHSFSIRPRDYIANRFVIGIDTEKVLEAGFTGLNIHAGDLLTAKFKYAKPAGGGAISDQHVAHMMHNVVHQDHILEIQDTGVHVCD